MSLDVEVVQDVEEGNSIESKSECFRKEKSHQDSAIHSSAKSSHNATIGYKVSCFGSKWIPKWSVFCMTYPDPLSTLPWQAQGQGKC